MSRRERLADYALWCVTLLMLSPLVYRLAQMVIAAATEFPDDSNFP